MNFEEMINNIKTDYKNIIIRLLFTVSLAITSLGYTLLNNYRGKVYNIQTTLDTIIPFNKYFIVPYLIWYLYVGFFIFYYSIMDDKRYFKILIGINVGMIISFIIFYFFPTTVPRPFVYGKDIFAKLVRLVYLNDNPYNCFPSIHVLDSVIIGAYVNRDPKISSAVKIISTSIAISIIFSTVFVKQHYVYDVVGGAALAYFMYFVCNYKEVSAKLACKMQVSSEKQVNVGEE
ncbi:phosphatase PAP2 family protein [Fonticella tunisiensis]|uniref:PAP2 superfamily protein n=1 Tax=Fonticella tunisiensis TaxID=1096341 RepID=A0A4R7KTE8_9CLOT|nr:phosphatase PAP2 family protein [Fonticella tunisiensis]TDT63367.1 PAP2 superfamily protein [Fonticella tunisiensis]